MILMDEPGHETLMANLGYLWSEQSLLGNHKLILVFSEAQVLCLEPGTLARNIFDESP